MKTLLLLAHPDDELFLLPILICESDLTVVYLTNSHRFQNSSDFLTIQFPKVHFLQIDDLLFNDGAILQEFEEVSLRLLVNFLNRENFGQLISHNFENSHQDHDAVAAICERIQNEVNLETLFTNFYAFRDDSKWLVKVRENRYPVVGKYLKHWSASRGELIWLCLKGFVAYRREWRVWTHLGPSLLWSYLLNPRSFAHSVPSPPKKLTPRWVYFSPHGQDDIQKFIFKLGNHKAI